jgi:hypothetical protein
MFWSRSIVLGKLTMMLAGINWNFQKTFDIGHYLRIPFTIGNISNIVFCGSGIVVLLRQYNFDCSIFLENVGVNTIANNNHSFHLFPKRCFLQKMTKQKKVTAFFLIIE